jgi:hypothetical protein
MVRIKQGYGQQGDHSCRRALRINPFKPFTFIKIERNSIREIVVFCKKKKRVSEQELGKKWIWIAIDTPTRLIVTIQMEQRKEPRMLR